MELLIAFAWFLLVIIIPLALLVIGYINYVNKVKTIDLIIKLFVAFLCYCFITLIVSWFIGLMIFLGAHTVPVGNALSTNQEIIYSIMIMTYGIIGWLLCSFVNGSLIKPWLIFSFSKGKSQSIFNNE